MTGINVKIWMWHRTVKAREIAEGYGCSESFVSRFLKGKRQSQGLVDYLVNEGCPKEHFKNGKVPWSELITRYDRPETFFYCDPPYYLCLDYKHNFVLEDFISMADQLGRIKGKFMLSINDHPDIREVFKDFGHKEVSLLYTKGQKGPTEANELIFTNFEMQRNRVVELDLFSHGV